jgi:hypothetical protein
MRKDDPSSLPRYFRRICPRISPPGKSPGPVLIGATPSLVCTLTGAARPYRQTQHERDEMTKPFLAILGDEERQIELVLQRESLGQFDLNAAAHSSPPEVEEVCRGVNKG